MSENGRVSRRADMVAACAIAAIALAPRIAMVVQSPPTGPIYDMADYWERAVYIAEHGRLYQNSFRMPGYPAALAAVFALGTGPSLVAAGFFNAAAGAVATLLTYWLARRTAEVGAATVAALLVALYPSFIVYTTLIATEAVVAVPLVATVIACTFRSRRAAVIAGVLAGFTVLVRPAGIALLPAVLLSFWRAEPAARWRAMVGPALAATAFVLTMAPWWLHNARLHGRFVPLDTSGGLTIAVGNHPLASGTYRWREAVPMLEQYVPGLDIFALAGSDRAIEMSIRYMRDHPGAVVRLAPAKLRALFALEGREHAFLYSWGYFGARTPNTVGLWALAVAAGFPLIVAAALAGVSVRGGVSRAVLVPSIVFIVSTLAMHVISFGDARYHLPIVPLLAVLATGLSRRANGMSRVRLPLAGAVLTLLAIAWWTQIPTHRATLSRISQPGGWNAQLSYDDLY